MTDWKTIKHESYLADLAKARADERAKVLSEVEGLIDKTLSGQKYDGGHDCYEKFCDYCDNNLKDGSLNELRAKLNQLKGNDGRSASSKNWIGEFAPNGGHDPNNPFPLKKGT